MIKVLIDKVGLQATFEGSTKTELFEELVKVYSTAWAPVQKQVMMLDFLVSRRLLYYDKLFLWI